MKYQAEMPDQVFSDIMDERCHHGLRDIISVNVIHKVIILVKDRLRDIEPEFAISERGVIMRLNEGPNERICLRKSTPSFFMGVYVLLRK